MATGARGGRAQGVFRRRRDAGIAPADVVARAASASTPARADCLHPRRADPFSHRR